MKMRPPIQIMVMAALCTITAVYAAEHNMSDDKPYTMTVTGTSTLHDWHIDVGQLDGRFAVQPEKLTVTSTEELLSLSDASEHPVIEVRIPVESLKSGKKGMDKVVYKALQEEDHPEITFTLTGLTLSDESENTEATSTPLLYEGMLTIAGTQRDVSFGGTVERKKPKQLTLTGAFATKMTEFSIQPPTAMMGMVKAGDDIEITFSWTVDLPQ